MTRTASTARAVQDTIRMRREMLACKPDSRRFVRLHEDIIRANMGLVHVVSQRLAPAHRMRSHDQRQDAFSETLIALGEVIPTWDPDGDRTLGNLLFSAAKARLRRHRDMNSGWGAASGHARHLTRIEMVEKEMIDTLGCEPTANEIAAELNARVEGRTDEKRMLLTGRDVEQIRSRLGRGGVAPVVVDADIHTSYGNGVDDLDGPDVVAVAGESAMFVEKTSEILDALANDEAIAAFRCRFGLIVDPGVVQPWSIVAAELGVSVRTAQRHVAVAREFVAEWMLTQIDDTGH